MTKGPNNSNKIIYISKDFISFRTSMNFPGISLLGIQGWLKMYLLLKVWLGCVVNCKHIAMHWSAGCIGEGTLVLLVSVFSLISIVCIGEGAFN